MNKSIGNNLPRIKVQNQFSIKETIYKSGPISRVEVAERLGLTLPTITTSVSNMIHKGLFKEVELSPEVKTLGRRAMLVDIDEGYGCFLGIEIRGSFRHAVIVDMKGGVKESLSDFTPFSEYEDVVENASSLFFSLLGKAGMKKEDIKAVGLTIPGIVDREKNCLVIHPGYRWADKALSDDFRSHTGYEGEIHVENNTIARAYAMSLFSKDEISDVDSLAYMYVSTGIACPLLSSIGSRFGEVTGDGEVGHMVMNPEGPMCVCGNRGCLESYSSEKSIIDRAEHLSSSSDILSSIRKEKGSLNIEDIVDAAQKGDEVSDSLIRNAIKYLGLAIANINNFVRPECIAVECALFSKEEYRDLLLSTVQDNLYRIVNPKNRFIFLPKDELRGAKGAAAIAIMHSLEEYIQ